MEPSTIEFTVTLQVLDATANGIQETRKLLAGDSELVTGGGNVLLSDALAEWLLPHLPQDVTAISVTIDVKPSPNVRPSPLDIPSGGGLGGGGQVGTSAKSLAQAGRKPPRTVTRGGSAKLTSSSK